jgi:hypothetical protein
MRIKNRLGPFRWTFTNGVATLSTTVNDMAYSVQSDYTGTCTCKSAVVDCITMMRRFLMVVFGFAGPVLDDDNRMAPPDLPFANQQ